MGIYVYKVTAQKKQLSDGRIANVAKFAYKPVSPSAYYSISDRDGCQINRSLAWKAKVHIAKKYVKESKNFTGLVVLGEDGEVPLKTNIGSFSDEWFYDQL